jgi:CRP-like cAMP-binding protein
MPPKRKAAFDPKAFLAKVGDGRRVVKHRRGEVVFSQGEAAEAVFYIQQGKVKLTIVSPQGKEAVVAILNGEISSVKAALPPNAAAS